MRADCLFCCWLVKDWREGEAGGRSKALDLDEGVMIEEEGIENDEAEEEVPEVDNA